MDQHTLAALFQQHGIQFPSFLPSLEFEDRLSYQGKVDQSTWQTLRSLIEVTGYRPVLTHESLEDIMACQSGKMRLPREIIDEGLRLNAESCVRKMIEAYHSFSHRRAPRGEWPDEIPPIRSMTEGGEASPSQPLILFPTKEGWRVPAYLNFGAWNECPSPHEHVCMMKHWQEHYGAEITYIGSTIVGLSVSRPPQDRESALRLAWEHFAYCSDTLAVAPEVETLDDLAASLLNSSTWSFWWD